MTVADSVDISENLAMRELIEMDAGIGVRRGWPAAVLDIHARGHQLQQVADSHVLTVVFLAALPAMMVAYML